MTNLTDNIEPTVIATLILKPDLLGRDEVLEVTSDWFQDDAYALLWDGINQRISEGKTLDLVWASEFLGQHGHKEKALEISQAVANVLHPDSELMSGVEILRNRVKRAELSTLITTTISRLDVESPMILARELGERISDLVKPNQEAQKIDVMTRIIERLNKPIEVEWGFPHLDYCTKGAERRTFGVIGAYTSNGKTTLLLHMAKNIARQGFPVHLFSTEMDEVALIEKLATIITSVNPSIHPHLSEDQKKLFIEGIAMAQDLPITISKTGSLAAIRMGVQKNIARVYFVDYLQMVHAERYIESDVKRLGYVARELEMLTKSYDTTIYTTSQFHRASKGMDDVPTISHFRGSGEIEEAMDIGIILYYPFQQANMDKRIEMKKEGKDKKMSLSVEKNRHHGLSGKIGLYFDRDTMEMKEIKEDETSSN